MRKKAICVILAVTLITALLQPAPARAYSPPYTNVKIGLYYGSGALQSANLQNVSGYGSGYQFGYFDANRQFVPIGAYATAVKISVIQDKNMRYDSASNSYQAVESGEVTVGCFHIQLDTAFSSFSEASAAASGYSGGFVKYYMGSFYALTGAYSSREAANAAMADRGISGASVNAGTANTVTVVETGTGRILFEFDYGSTYYLGVMPVQDGANKCETWFKGYRYNGGFQYSRPGDLLTVINFVDIEDYVKGLLPYEMGNDWPLEALKAQAVCARTYAMAGLNNHGGSGFDLCTTDHCQVYQGRGQANAATDRAVNETAGQYITYNGALCQTYYASCDGGATENVENVWGGTAIPYLKGVVDPYEGAAASKIAQYNWTVSYTQSELTARLNGKGYSCSTIVYAAVTEYSPSGNAVSVTLRDSAGKTITFTRKGDTIRNVFGLRSIRFAINGAAPSGAPAGDGNVYVNSGDKLTGDLSSYYAVGGQGEISKLQGGGCYAITGSGTVEAITGSDSSGVVTGTGDGAPVNGSFTFSGTGKGHNVGMSQWGAYAMAVYYSKSYLDIINFYFTGVAVG